MTDLLKSLEETDSLLKSHVKSYTRADGTIVKEHDDSRQKKASSGPYHSHKNAFVTHTDEGWGRVTHVAGGDLTHRLTPEHQKKIAALKDGKTAKFTDMNGTKLEATRQGEYVKIVPPSKKSTVNTVAKISDIDPDATPAKHNVRTENEGYGYHGEAMGHHGRLSVKGDPDRDWGRQSEGVYQTIKAKADNEFAAAANHLVEKGHFSDHQEAGRFLDSRIGRHMADSASRASGGRSISLKDVQDKDLADAVKRYKKDGSDPIRRSLDDALDDTEQLLKSHHKKYHPAKG